jgi:hypothetical protein
VINTVKGHEIVVWRSRVATSGPRDSDSRSLRMVVQMTRTSLMWRRSIWKLVVPREIEAVEVGRIDKWRAWVLRQITMIGRNYYWELVVDMVIISILF